MKKAYMIPPECCVIIEMEQGVTLEYRKAVLLNEIQALGPLTKAAKVSKIDQKHARELILEMNSAFSQPLVDFGGNPQASDQVKLTENGAKTTRAY